MADTDFSKEVTQPDLSSLEDALPTCPSMIGPYKIESRLGKGGMSYLYLGTHPSINKPIVIKVLSPKFIENKELVDRFLKEAKIIEMTNHPNIVKLYGQGKWEKGLYIAMEFIQGISLRQFILQKSLSKKRALEIILQVAYALCHLHSHGVIHRDLKPENILITESGEVKVIDFGIAQLFSDKEEKTNVKNQLIGTPVYMSPEQKENSNKVSFASDIYSLGLITYELVLGKLSHGIVHLPLITKELREIIEKSLKPSLKERYEDIVEFITDISAYLKSYVDNTKIEIKESSELAEEIITYHNLCLIKSKPISSTQIELGYSVSDDYALTGIYFDYFKLSENKHLIILAEPKEHGIKSILLTSIFKGIVLSQISNTKNFDLLVFVNSLQKVLSINDNSYFHANFILLSPDTDQITFASFGYNDIFMHNSKTMKITKLNTPNPLLGKDNPEISELKSNWNIGDKLIIPSLEILNNKNETEKTKKQAELKQAILDNVMFSAKHQAKKILEKMEPDYFSKFSKRKTLVICIQRVF